MKSKKPDLAEMYLALVAGPAAYGKAMNQEALRADTLPRELRGERTREILQSWGVVFEDQLPEGHGLSGSSELMQTVILPPGWHKRGDGGGYWTNVLDDLGRKRASYFYKGAFYDRDAFLHLSRRFRAAYTQDDGQRDDPVTPIIEDGGKIIWRGTPVPHQEFKHGEFLDEEGNQTDCPDCGDRYERKVANCNTCGCRAFPTDMAQHQAVEVLKQYYPDWEDPAAYWDVDPVVLPAWESQAPAGERYSIWVGLYRMSSNSGFYRRPEFYDGGHHDTIRAEGVEAAKVKAEALLRERFSSYARVEWRLNLLQEDGETHQVAEGAWEKPQERTMFKDVTGRTFYYDGEVYFNADGFEGY